MNSDKNKITSLKDLKKKQKKEIVEELKKTPIIQYACQKYNVPRSTFYRWTKSSKEFEKEVKAALVDGCDLINDLAISQLISKIKNGDNTMTIFWLKCKHPDFLDVKRINHVITEKRENTITEGREAEIAQAIFNWESSCKCEKDKTFIACKETEVKQKKSDIKQKRLTSGY